MSKNPISSKSLSTNWHSNKRCATTRYNSNTNQITDISAPQL